MSARIPLVAGNWKMHLKASEARTLAGQVAEAARDLPGIRFVLAPPFTALAAVAEAVEGSPVGVAGQNLHWEDKGAFTGEVSGPMLTDAGCHYVIVGHSERRQFFAETDETVGRKVRAALRHGLSPILCVGESLSIREDGRTLPFIERQVEAALDGVDVRATGNVILAYEPVWAIGTGLTASPGQAEEVQAFLRGWLGQKYGNPVAACAIIIYGGSVKPANAFSLIKEEDIDGFLVGGASLEADSFIGIARESLHAEKEKK
ncbi:MAG: triose-phosphate isomerase [Candidatus Aminicenantes bacterium]|nr:triose-phosphate isomerase [Candidatus Aminicenantes bacterium]